MEVTSCSPYVDINVLTGKTGSESGHIDYSDVHHIILVTTGMHLSLPLVLIKFVLVQPEYQNRIIYFNLTPGNGFVYRAGSCVTVLLCAYTHTASACINNACQKIKRVNSSYFQLWFVLNKYRRMGCNFTLPRHETRLSND